MHAIKAWMLLKFQKRGYSERKENAQHRGPKCWKKSVHVQNTTLGTSGGPGLRTHLPIQGWGFDPVGEPKSHMAWGN